MAENRREKDKRFYFSGGQMVLLSCAFILASAVIFFFGIFVGKNIEERKIVKNQEPLVKIPVKPQAAGSIDIQGAPPKDEMTFYNTLTKPAESPSPVAGQPKETKPPEKLARAEVKERKSPAKEETAPATKAKEKSVEKSPTPSEAAKKTSTGESREASSRGWTVQINAFPDDRSAKTWVDRLKNKGYNAYVSEVQNKGKTWYRVRVGSYASREEAKKVEDVLKNKENLSKAFSTSR